jgi:hypothetical protein
MTKPHTYRVRIEVDHYTRDEAIHKLEDIVFKLKAKSWPQENIFQAGEYPNPKVIVDMGPIAPSVEDRLARLEREFEYRLGGLSEDAA